MPDSDHGTPFDAQCSDPIDDWSRAVFEACRDWPLARSGRWFRVEEGGLRLRIEAFEGEVLEPLFAIDVDAIDDHVLVDFGGWATRIHPTQGQLAADAAEAVAKAGALIERWLRGETRLVVYADESGWRSHKLIEGGDLPDALAPAPIALDQVTRAVVKTPRRREWRYFHHDGDGTWVEHSEGDDAA